MITLLVHDDGWPHQGPEDVEARLVELAEDTGACVVPIDAKDLHQVARVVVGDAVEDTVVRCEGDLEPIRGCRAGARGIAMDRAETLHAAGERLLKLKPG